MIYCNLVCQVDGWVLSLTKYHKIFCLFFVFVSKMWDEFFSSVITSMSFPLMMKDLKLSVRKKKLFLYLLHQRRWSPLSTSSSTDSILSVSLYFTPYIDCQYKSQFNCGDDSGCQQADVSDGVFFRDGEISISFPTRTDFHFLMTCFSAKIFLKDPPTCASEWNSTLCKYGDAKQQ